MATRYDKRIDKLEGQGANLFKVHACHTERGLAPELGVKVCGEDVCRCADIEAEFMRETRNRGTFIRMSHSEGQF